MSDVRVGGFNTRFSSALPMASPGHVLSAIDLYKAVSLVHGEDADPFNFEVKASDDGNSLIVYNEEGVTHMETLCRYLLTVGKLLMEGGDFLITYACTAPMDTESEQGGGIVYVDFFKDHQFASQVTLATIAEGVINNPDSFLTLLGPTVYTVPFLASA